MSFEGRRVFKQEEGNITENRDNIFLSEYLASFDGLSSITHTFFSENRNDKNFGELSKVSFSVKTSLNERIEKFITCRNISFEIFYNTLWCVLLSRFSSSSDILYGRFEGEKTIPCRVKYDNESSFLDLTYIVKEEINKTRKQVHQIQDWLSTSGIFDAFDSIVVDESMNYFTSEVLEKFKPCKPNIVLSFNKETVSFYYSERYFCQNTVKQLFSCLCNAMESVLEDPEQKVLYLNILSTEEKDKLFNKWNATEYKYDSNICIHQLFERRALETPQNIALQLGDRYLTYEQLNTRANQVAYSLKSKGVQKNDIVGLMVRRSFEMIIGVLAILKAGAAYVPIDPSYPMQRIVNIKNNSNYKLLLSTRKDMEYTTEFGQVLYLDEEKIYDGPTENLDLNIESDSLAYIIYTSGSTGTPKGVMIEHRNVLNTLYDLERKYPVGLNDAYLLKTTFTFDVSVSELFGWFVGHGRLVILEDGGEKDPYALFKAVDEYQVTHINFVPSMLSALLDYNHEFIGRYLKSIKYMMMAGEEFTVDLLNKLKKLNPSFKIENLYGPTEASIYATGYSIDINKQYKRLPIGSPFSNVQCYIIDTFGNPVPVGVLGRLYLGGAGIARGYMGRDDLTNERFQNFELNGRKIRLYDTGDMARWTVDGLIEYFGRTDNQLKIKGYRIELGEIEALIRESKDIKEAVVALKGKSKKYLAAYIVPNNDTDAVKECLISEVKEFLEERLPEYMLPLHYVTISSLPLLPSGKIDRNKLPDPEKRDFKKIYRAPENKIQKDLTDIWAYFFNEEKIGVDDNFFELGGDSILGIQISAKAHQTGYKIGVQDIFKYKTISGLSEKIMADYSQNNGHERIEGVHLLTPYQTRLLKKGLYNIGDLNRTAIIDVPKSIPIESLDKLMAYLVEYHDGLRISFKKDSGEWKASYGHISNNYCVEFLDLVSYNKEALKEKIKQIRAEIRDGLSIEGGPVVKAVLCGLGNDEEHNCLLLAFHNLVMDEASCNIFLDDAKHLIDLTHRGEAFTLPPKTLPFENWSFKPEFYVNDIFNEFEQISENEEYYSTLSPIQNIAMEEASATAVLDETKQLINLVHMNDYMKKQGLIYFDSKVDDSKRSLIYKLDPNRTEILEKKCNLAYNTKTKELLLTALCEAYNRCSGISNLKITIEENQSGRLQEDADFCRTIGQFTLYYPTILRKGNSLGDTITSVKDSIFYGLGYENYSSPENYILEMNEYYDDNGVVFNYLGLCDKLDEEYIQAICEIQKKKNPLGIISFIRDNQLVTIFNSIYELDSLEGLIECYKVLLDEIIEYCLDPLNARRTIYDFPLARLGKHELKSIYRQLNIPENSDRIEAIYPLSPIQEGMMFESIHNQGKGIYVTQLEMPLKESLNVESLKRSWSKIVEHYPIFRTRFCYEGLDRPVQVVLKNIDFEIKNHDFSALPSEEAERLFSELMNSRREEGFTFNSGVMMHVDLIRLPDSSYKMLWSNHHIIIDGWSITLIIKALSESYNSFSMGKEPVLSYSEPYESYIKWINKQDESKAMNFWREYLIDFETPTPLPLVSSKRQKGLNPGKEFGRRDFKLSKDTYLMLDQISKEHHVTFNTIIQVCWGIMLSSYTNSSDIVFGVISSGRPVELKGADTIVGPLISTLPLRIKLDEDISIKNLMLKVQEDNMLIREYEYSALKDIVKWSEVEQEQGLFKMAIAFENYPEDRDAKKDNVISLLESSFFETPHYPLGIACTPVEDGLIFTFFFDRYYYEETTFDRILCHFESVIHKIASDCTANVSTSSVLSPDEEKKILVEWNNTSKWYERELGLHQIVELYAQENYNKIALYFGEESMSYGELERRAHGLSCFLKEQGVMSGDIVGLLVERSFELVIGMLAILKCGATYCPLDPDYPVERLEYMVKDTGSKVVLKKCNKTFSFTGVEIINLEEKNIYHDVNRKSVLKDFCSKQPAYVMYTSGSTGQPKGVLVSHENITRLIKQANYMEISDCEVFLQMASISFDASTLEIWGALLSGSSLAIMPPEKVSVELLKRTIQRNKVSVLLITASFFNVVVAEDIECFKGIRQLMVGGDILSKTLIEKVGKEIVDCRIINGYGPTENTTNTCCYTVPMDIIEDKIPIGYPVTNTTVYVLDRNLNLVCPGAVGELYTGGLGVSHGYLNNAKLTAEKFVPNPFDSGKGERLYATGDLVRWLEDGRIEFLGRRDSQIKIRGFRVELGEIEEAVLKNSHIKDCYAAAINQENGRKIIAIYYMLKDSSVKLTDDELTGHLNKYLPSYMIPQAYIEMESFPLTLSGKIDRKALPKPFNRARIGYGEPVTDTEKALADIWCQVLKLDHIGVHDKFFALGGDSILSIQICSRARRLGYNINTQDIFQYPTIYELSHHLNDEVKIIADQDKVSGEQILTPIQNWFFEKELNNKDHFNQSFFLEVPKDLSLELISRMMVKLVETHDALRLRFKKENEKWVSTYGDSESSIKIEWYDLSSYSNAIQKEKIEEIGTSVKSSLSIENGPVSKVALFELGKENEKNIMLWTIHHLSVDMVSWSILLENLRHLYNQAKNNECMSLPLKSTSYQHWAKRLLEYATEPKVLEELSYWSEVTKNSNEFPVSYADQSGNIREYDTSIVIKLDAQRTSSLLTKASDAYNTKINDLLLVGFIEAYNQWSSRERLIIELESHGREELFKDVDVSRTVGWFTAIYPVVLEKGKNLEDTIKKTKENLRKIKNRGIGFGILKYLSGVINSDFYQNEPLVTFNYLGQLNFTSGEEISVNEKYKVSDFSKNQRRFHLLEIESYVVDGELNISFNYSSKCYDAKHLQKLANSYIEKLWEIVRLCEDPLSGGRTVSDFPLAKLEEKELEQIFNNMNIPLNSRNIEAIYPLSPVQSGMLFESLNAENQGVYITQLELLLGSSLNFKNLEKSWKKLLNHYPIFRTRFCYEGLKRPMQVVFKEVDLKLEMHDFNGKAEEIEKKYEDLKVLRSKAGIDFVNGPLMYVDVVRLCDGRYKMLWTHHHILTDGWSMPIALNGLIESYFAYNNGMEPSLPYSASYESYIEWMERQDSNNAKEFWKACLEGFESITPLPMERSSRDKGLSPKECYHQFDRKFKSSICDQLLDISRKYNVTVNTVIQVCWGILLSRCTNTEDVLYGVVSSGRPADLKGSESIVGVLISTMPLRIKLHEDLTIKDLLEKVQKDNSKIRSYEYYSLMDIQKLSEVQDNHGLFQTILVYENYPYENRDIDQTGLPILGIDTIEIPHYPLTVAVTPGDRFGVSFYYDTYYYSEEIIQALFGHMECIIERMHDDSACRIKDIELISNAERNRIMEWNKTEADYEKGCIHEFLEKRAAENPERTGVIIGEQKYSYGEINALSNRVAHYLKEMEIAERSKVGIMTSRSIEMITGILGILKAGAAYVPIDPSYPRERIESIIKTAGISLILSKREDYAVTDLTAEVRCIDELDLEVYPETNPRRNVSHGDAAYIIFTSGSTGTPKGVIVEHRNAVNTLCWLERMYTMREGDVYLLKTPYTFDVSVSELFGWFMGCGSLAVLEPGAEKDPEAILDAINKYGITHINFVPSMLNAFVEAEEDKLKSGLSGLRYLIVAGEAFGVRLWERLKKLELNTRVENLYGPTEASIYATGHSLKGEYSIVPIGRPIGNTKAYILDRSMHLCPVGTVGELYLGGSGVARGYINADTLTKERFIEDIITKNEGGMLYRTGDLARWTQNGEIEYLGRIDGQVKIRGNRIELGEIEEILSRNAAVKQCVVSVIDEKGNKSLAAYYILKDKNQPVGPDELKEHLKAYLPPYMIPQAFVEMESFPLTSSGKLDRRALPVPEHIVETEYAEPLTHTEKMLTGIWKEVLKLERVGIHDNFFALGGDSILSIQISSLAKKLNYKVRVHDIFKHPTIWELSQHISEAHQINAEQGTITGEQVLTPVQYWFFEHDLQNKNYFNQSYLLDVPKDLSIEVLDRIIGYLVSHHDTLRLRFRKEGNHWQAYYGDVENSYAIEAYDLSAYNCEEQERKLSELETSVKGSLSIEDGPMVKVALFELGNLSNKNYVLITIHHLAVDVVSWKILLEDLTHLYKQSQNNESFSLPFKSTSYQYWGKKLWEYAQSESLKAEEEYWENVTRHYEEFPMDYPEATEADNIEKYNESVCVEISSNETNDLLINCLEAYNTRIIDLLLTALIEAYNHWSGKNKLVINLEGHGREELFDEVDVSRTVGWFTSIYPVVLEKDSTLGETIKKVKENLRNIPNKGIGYGILKYLSERKADLNADVKVTYNYLGYLEKTADGQIISGMDVSNSDGYQGNKRTDNLDIVAYIRDGRLNIVFTYSSKCYRRDRIETLANRYIDMIKTIVVHCTDSKQGGRTVSDYPLARFQEWELDQVFSEMGISQNAREVESIYPLSPVQEGMLFESLNTEGHGIYITQLGLILDEHLDVECLQKSWKKLVSEYAVFRSKIYYGGLNRTFHIVFKETDFTIDCHDYSLFELNEGLEKYEKIKKQRREAEVRFKEGPLMHVDLIRLADGKYRMLWSHHHILIDGWSIPIVLKSLSDSYSSYLLGREPELKYSEAYESYIGWLEKQDRVKARNFWEKYLAEFETSTPIPLRRAKLPKGIVPKECFEQREVILGKDTYSKLVSISKKHSVTVNTIIQVCWGIMLCNYTDSNDIVFGVVSSGRPSELKGAENMVGALINTMPLRIRIDNNTTIEKLLNVVQENNIQIRNYEYIPLSEIHKISGIEPGQDLFNTLVAYENYPYEHRDNSQNNGLSVLGFDSNETPHYPLTLGCVPGKEFRLVFHYDTYYYCSEIIDTMYYHLQNLIENIYRNSSCSTSKIDFLRETEREKLLNKWNNTYVVYERNLGLHELVEQYALKAPSSMALMYGDIRMSYSELDNRANGLAGYLRELGVKPGDFVGIAAERSIELVVGMLAVLKCWAAFCPLDLEYPTERLEYIIKDTGIKLLLTNVDNLPKVTGTKVVDLRDGSCYNSSLGSAAGEFSAKQAAYVMYTSGSTGQPKGVVVSHENITRLVKQPNYISVDKDDVFLLLSAVNFDASTLEIWGALLNGCRLAIAPPERLSVELLKECIEKYSVSILWLTASFFNMVVNEDVSCLKGVKQLLAGGDVLSKSSVERVLKEIERCTVINGYGPTENTTFTCCYRMEENIEEEKVPIGYPISNTSVYVLDRNMNLVCPGGVGELYTGGLGVSHGYLNNSKMTAEKYVPNPFASGVGERLYRTGDLVRWLEDGRIEFIGRKDFQVKIRGFRVELGEIETVISSHDCVKESYVAAIDEGGGRKNLVAYYVLKSQENKVDERELKEFLEARLPSYMVPGAYVEMESFPMTSGGKLDRRALPVPKLVSETEYVEPVTQVEQVLAGVWREVLKLEQIGIHDNFFALGGDSILSIQISYRAKRLGYNVKVNDIFRYPTIYQLSHHVEKDSQIQAQQDAITGEQLLTPIQRWFFGLNLKNKNYFNQSFMLEIPKEISLNTIIDIIEKVVETHDVLRMRFRKEGEEWKAYYGQLHESYNVEVYDLSSFGESDLGQKVEELGSRIKSSLCIENGPLLKAALFELGHTSENNWMLITIHHLVVDMVSWRIILEDIKQLYNQYRNNERLLLPEKSTSYQFWSKKLHEYILSGSLEQEVAYWKNIISEQDGFLSGYTDLEKISSTINTSEKEIVEITKELTVYLLENCSEAYNTQINDLLLSALIEAYKKWNGQDSLKLMLEGHGREELFKDVDISRTVGWFTSLYPVVLKVGDTLGNTIKKVKESMRGIPQNGIGFGMLKYLGRDGEYFEENTYVSFNYLGQLDFISNESIRPIEQNSGNESDLENKGSYLLDIICYVKNRRLTIEFHYSPMHNKQEQIEKLAFLYKESLEEIIRHCSDSGKKEYTPSDFPKAGLNEDELRNILMEFL